MRTALGILLLLAGLALPPAQAGGWKQEPRREPPRPQMRASEPQRAPPQQMYAPPRPQAEPMRPQQFAPPGGGMSRDEAIRRAQQMNGGGRVLAADPAENGYRVRVLKDGEVRSVYVPQ